MPNSNDINQAFNENGGIIDVTPSTTARDIVASQGFDPNTTDLVQKTNSGGQRIIKSNQRFDPRQGQNIEFQIHGDEGV